MIIVKLGGSFVTYKGADSTMPMRWDESNIDYRIREDLIIKVARILKSQIKNGLILVHGGGTHGHRTVVRWRSGIARGNKIMMPWEIKWRMVQLSERVIRLLGKGGIPAVSISPGDLILSDRGLIRSFDATAISRYLERGVVPVLRGDLVPDTSEEWAVVSGDEMIFEIGRLSKEGVLPELDRVILCMKEEGYYEGFGTDNKRIISELSPDRFHRDVSGRGSTGDGSVDVSGGISGKIAISHRIASYGIPVNLIGGENVHIELGNIIGGKNAGTLVLPFEGSIDCRSGACH
ncbi:MAG: isopentenyl phosphate kinase [Thermoplasmatota archaeon]